MTQKQPTILIRQKKMRKMFKKGDFVRVKNNTHDENMPPSRLGHIVEEYQTIFYNVENKRVPTGLWRVFMTNGKILKFHEMFLEKIDVTDGE